MPAHYALPIVVVKGRESALDARTERVLSGSALNPLEPLDLNSSLRQGLPTVGPISTNSISSGGRRRSRKSSRDLGAWGKPRSPRHNLSCANRPSPNRTIAVLTKSKPSASVVYEPPSPTEQGAPRVVPGAKKEERKERLRQITLGQLIQAKRIVEANGVTGDEAIARSRAATATAAAAVHSARCASDAVQDCVALMLEDFRLMEHQPAWRLAVAPLLPDVLAAAGGVAAGSAAAGGVAAGGVAAVGGVAAGGGVAAVSGGLGEVAALLLRQFEAGEADHPAHRATLLLRSEQRPDSLTVVASTIEAVGAVQRLKPNSLWHASSTHPLARDAFAALRSGNARLRSPHGTAAETSAVPLKDSSGRTFGVLLSLAPALPDPFVQVMVRAAEPAFERAWKRERAERLLQSACEWLGRLGRAQGVKLSASWRRDDAPAEPVAAAGAQPGGSAGALGQPRAAVLAAGWRPLRNLAGAGLRAVRAEVRWSGGALGDGCLGVLELCLAPPPVANGLAGLVAAAAGGGGLSKEEEARQLRGMALLHAAVPLLRAAVAEVEVGGVGGGAAKVAGFGSLPAFDAHVRSWVAALPAALEAQLLEQMRTLDAYQLIAELRAYASPSQEVRKVVAGVLALLGRDEEQTVEWDAARQNLKVALFQKEMREMAISRESEIRVAAEAKEAVAAAKEAASKRVGCQLIATAAADGVAAALPGLLIPRALAPRAGAAGARRRDARKPPATAPAPPRRLRVEQLPPLERAKSAGARGGAGAARGGAVAAAQTARSASTPASKRGARRSKDGKDGWRAKNGGGAAGTAGTTRSVWAASAACTKGLNLETLLTSGESSFPVRVLCSWLQTARLVHGLDEVLEADAAAAEAASAAADAAATAAAEAKSMAEMAKAAAEAEVAAAESSAAEATAAGERAEAVAVAEAAAAVAAKPTHVALRAILARQVTQVPALPRQLGKEASKH